MNKPTPTRHGAWRVVDGELVDEDLLVTRSPGLPAEEVRRLRALIYGTAEPVTESAQPVADSIEQIPPGEPIPVYSPAERTAEPGEALPPLEPQRGAKPHSRRKAPSNAQ